MSLNDTGKFIDSIKRIGGIDKSLDITSQAKAIIETLEDVDNIDDVSRILQLSGVSKELGSAVLNGSQFKD